MLIAIHLGNGTWHASQLIRLVTRLPLETENLVAYNELCVQFYSLWKGHSGFLGSKGKMQITLLLTLGENVIFLTPKAI
jgi:hypothetical protein